jgi:hypothetical protein
MAPHYRSYLLRVWARSLQEGWRVSLESVTTGERLTFTRPEELMAFLDSQLEAGPDESPAIASD